MTRTVWAQASRNEARALDSTFDLRLSPLLSQLVSIIEVLNLCLNLVLRVRRGLNPVLGLTVVQVEGEDLLSIGGRLARCRLAVDQVYLLECEPFGFRNQLWVCQRRPN